MIIPSSPCRGELERDYWHWSNSIITSHYIPSPSLTCTYVALPSPRID